MSNPQAALCDSFGRRASYLRLSVTDRCNLRCRYCVSGKRQKFIPHERILRYEEFYRLISISKSLGVRKVRVTGGEPFARKDIMKFLTSVRSRFPDLEIALTTNATLLEDSFRELAALGLSSINISLDSFDRETVRAISGHDTLPVVLASLERLLSLGQTVKINAVAMAGITDLQMPDFIHAIRAMPVDIRFIEYMPMGGNTLWAKGNFISCTQLKQIAGKTCALVEAAADGPLAGPARMYEIPGAKGRLGFISAVTDHFCNACNRMRITSEGRLRTCLFADAEIRLAPLLRAPCISDANIARAIQGALRKKPRGSELLAARSGTAVARRQMVGIGG